MAFSSGVRHMMTEALVWASVGAAGVMAVVHLGSLADTVAPQLANLEQSIPVGEPVRTRSGSVELKADRYGHFIAPAAINGRSVDVMIDTGASLVALTYEDAARIGLRVAPADFTQRVSTANGQARVAPVRLQAVSIGDVEVRNVQAVVAERGRLETTLLGMTFLSRVGKVEMTAGRLVLQD